MPGLPTPVRGRDCGARAIIGILTRLAGVAALALFAALAPAGMADAQGTLAGGDSVSVHVLARVHPLSPGNARGAYTIEFGVLPASMIAAAGGSTAAAVEANQRFLPDGRYLSETKIRGQARAGDRSWLRSSAVSIPVVGGGVSPRVLEGRVIARWNPKPGGPLRVEFGFLPKWALDAAGGNVQAAARMHAALPASRYLSENTISGALRRSSPQWIRSSAVDVPFARARERVQVQWSGYPPGQGRVGESLTAAQLRVALPPAVQWSAAYSTSTASVCRVSNSRTGAISLIAEGVCEVTVTVTAAGYEPGGGTARVRVEDVGQVTPTITWAGYFPETVVGQTAPTIRPPLATAGGSRVELTYTYSVAPPLWTVCRVDRTSGRLMITGVGVCEVTVTSAATERYLPGRAMARVQVQAGPVERVEPTITWAGYLPGTVRLGQTAPMLLPPLVAVDGVPVRLDYTYSVAPFSSACSVDPDSGQLTINGEGTCEVTVTSAATERYLSGQATARVQVEGAPQVEPTIRWAGYLPGAVRPGQTAPRFQPPLATVGGAVVQLAYSYSVAPFSSACSVDSNSGALTITGVGECVVTLTSAETEQYLPAQATARVQVEGVERVMPTIMWAGYSPAAVRLGQTAPRLQRPTATARGAAAQLTYSYSVAPFSSACSVDPNSGALTITGVGECVVTLTSSETERYLPARATARVEVQSAPQVRPTITWGGYFPTTVELGQTAPGLVPPLATVGGQQVRLTYTYSVAPPLWSVCRVDPNSGQLTIAGRRGTCEVTATSAATDEYLPGRATAQVTVRERRNQAPVVRPQHLWQRATPRVGCDGRPPKPEGIGLNTVFSDPDRDDLTYRVVRIVPDGVVHVWYDDFIPVLNLQGLRVGEATITVRATDPGGLYAEADVRVPVLGCPGQGGGNPPPPVTGGGDDTGVGSTTGVGTEGLKRSTGSDDDTGVVDSPGGRGAYPPTP